MLLPAMSCFIVVEGVTDVPTGTASTKVTLTRASACAALEAAACFFTAAAAFFSVAAATLLDVARILGGVMEFEV